MGVTYLEMLETPWHVILDDLEMIDLEDNYPVKPKTQG